jgi:hypothetical protein
MDCASAAPGVVACGNAPSGSIVHAYSNHSDLREQLRQAAVILSEKAWQDNGLDSDAEDEVRSTTRW